MSFGEVAVDGFFLLSGYLITMSFARTATLQSYVIKRLARIVPGYLAAFALCFWVIAPCVGGELELSLNGAKHFISQTGRLLPPYVSGAFRGLPYVDLDGSMWTIAYEARCYVAVGAFGLLTAYCLKRISSPKTLLVITIGYLALFLLYVVRHRLPSPAPTVFGSAIESVRLGFIFATGSLFYVFSSRITYRDSIALVCSLLTVIGMYSRHLAEPDLALCGGYVLFWFAFRVRPLRLSKIANRIDISYGLYLYAWPIQNLLIWNDRHIDPWALCAATLVLAGTAGLLSWSLIEAPFLRFARFNKAKLSFASLGPAEAG